MKRIIVFAITILLIFSMSIVAFADLGDADFDNWTVVCGPAGFYFEDVPKIEQEGEDMHDYLEPGTKLWVHSFYTPDKTYLLVIDYESNHKKKGHGFVSVTEAQLNKYFIGEKKAFRPNDSMKLDKKVKCIVTPSVGLVLRQGPDKEYPSFKVIPQNTKLTYRYVYEGEQYNWGYVTYNGRDGWCCIDYTEKIETTTEPTTTEAETTTETTTKPTTELTSELITEVSDETTSAPVVPLDAADPGLVTETAEENETSDFFGNTRTVVIVCCAGAVILALTAVVILMIVKRKKNS